MKFPFYIMAAGLCLTGAARAAPERPNVLFIIFDDLNDSVARMGGHPQAKTPNIDRLMERGVRFTNAQSNAPLCSPSRPSMLTGMYPHTTRFFGGHEQDSPGKKRWREMPAMKTAKTWMEHFTDHGYDVWGTGKIYHNGSEDWNTWKNSKGEMQFGIKPSWGPYATDGRRWTGEGPMKGWLNRVSHPAIPGVWHGSHYVSLDQIPRMKPDPKTGAPGFDGWQLYGESYRYVSETDRDPLPDEMNAAFAATLLKQKKFDKPFMLNVGFNRPHAPWVAPKQYFDRFPLDQIEVVKPRPGDLDDCARILVDVDRNYGGNGFGKYSIVANQGNMKKWTQAYLACVNYVDEQFGKVLNALEDSPYADNTLIILTSDHGYHMGEKFYLFKWSVWEESCRVPFVVAGPGVARNQECSQPVSLVDIYPTLTDFCGLPEPESHILDGRSIVPLLKNPQGSWSGPDVAVSVVANRDYNAKPQHTPDDIRGVANSQHYSARSKDYRYILCANGEEELYDHRNDPNEWTNLATNPEYAVVKKKLRAQLEAVVGEPLGQWKTKVESAQKAEPKKNDGKTGFERSDANSDGLVSLKEWLADKQNPDFATQRFRDFDTDNDGNLTPEEMAAGWRGLWL